MNTQQTNQTKRVPFDLAKYKPGVKCFYRNGDEARIICTDGPSIWQGVAQPVVSASDYGVYSHSIKGRVCLSADSLEDLFMELPTTRRALTMADIPLDKQVWIMHPEIDSKWLVTEIKSNGLVYGGVSATYEQLMGRKLIAIGADKPKPCYIEE